MERERLTRLVEEPGLVGRGDVADLHVLAERYPWFAGAQVLRTLGEQKIGEVGSEEVLRTAAAHVPSRTVLFDLVARQDPPVAVQLTVVREAEAPVMPVVEQVLEVTPTSEVLTELGLSGSAPGPIDPGEEATRPGTSAVLEGELGTEPISDGSAEVGLEAGSTTDLPTAEAPDPLDLQIREAAMATAYDLSYLEQLPPLAPRITQPVPPPAHATANTEPPEPGVPARPAIAKSDRLRFTDWLSASEEAFTPEPAPPNAVALSPDTTDWLRSQQVAGEKPEEPANIEPPVEEPRTTAPVLEQVDTRELIDRFIRQQTPVPPPKHDTFYTPQQAAKRSLDDTAGIVTETLARVYVKQGNLPKAIRAYHKLALKYPEKSAYFAALAKELEAQQHK
jgi:hypothetical protein